MNKLIIGLTGLIGSGKSTVANLFAKLNVNIIDTDLIAHELTSLKHGEVLAEIRDCFGAEVSNDLGELKRKNLREIVFNSVEKKQQLEDILHPRILRQVLTLLNQANGFDYDMIVVPLLFKSPQYLSLTDYNIFVDSPEPLILDRVYQRSQLTSLEVQKILKSQVSRDLQRDFADDIITNSDTLDTLFTQVMCLHNKYNAIRSRL